MQEAKKPLHLPHEIISRIAYFIIAELDECGLPDEWRELARYLLVSHAFYNAICDELFHSFDLPFVTAHCRSELLVRSLLNRHRAQWVVEIAAAGGKVNGDLNKIASNAAERGFASCLSEALDLGVSPDHVSQNHPLLHLAVSLGHLECVRVLLQHGANIESTVLLYNEAYRKGSITPLAQAVWNNYPKIVRELLHSGANPAVTIAGRGDGNNVETLLEYCRACGQLDMVETLLLSGAT